MENTENNTPIVNKMPEFNNDTILVSGSKKLTKKKRIIIIIAIFVLISLLVTYLFLDNIKPAERIPTLEEKIQNIENVVNETAQIGLPPENTQLDIMNYNQAE